MLAWVPTQAAARPNFPAAVVALPSIAASMPAAPERIWRWSCPLRRDRMAVTMKTTLSFDRYEGRFAVLLTDEGQQIDFPKELAPKGSQAR